MAQLGGMAGAGDAGGRRAGRGLLLVGMSRDRVCGGEARGRDLEGEGEQGEGAGEGGCEL